MSGSVIDVYGNPISAATVTAADPTGLCAGSNSTKTTSSGSYTVDIPPGVSDSAEATSTQYTSKSMNISVSTASGANVFQLQYALGANASSSTGSSWVQPGNTITIAASTSAPPPSPPGGFACVWGQGVNGYGVSQAPTPVQGVGGNGTLSGVSALKTAYGENSLALLSNGTVAAWGDNSYGQLGNGTTSSTYESAPVEVEGVGGSGTLSGVAAIAAGFSYGMALLSNGTVVTWGANSYGQLGNGTTSDSSTPVQVEGVGGNGTLGDVVAIAAGRDDQSLALLSNGTVVAWGDNYSGELGNGTTTLSSTPIQVDGVGGSGTLSGVAAIAAGGEHSMALLSNGTVVTWGDNSYGQLGNGTTTSSTFPVQVEGVGGNGTLGGVAAVAAGEFQSMALLSNGTVMTWGSGELGNGTTNNSSTPVQVEGVGGNGTLSGVVAIAAGNSHSLALLSNGTVVAWGDNTFGQLGYPNGSNTYATTPGQVEGSGGTGLLNSINSIAAGDDTSMALRSVPCSSPIAATQVIAQLPNGSVFHLIQGVTSSDGFTKWEGVYDVPAGTADGTYTIKVCAVDVTFQANCDQAQTDGAPAIVTPDDLLTYGVWSSPPTIDTSVPAPNGNATTTPVISVEAYEPASGPGLSTSSVAMKIDGGAVAETTTKIGSAYLISYAIPATNPLTNGSHTVNVQVADSAGNVATYSWQFVVMGVTATPASVMMPSSTNNAATVPTNPTSSTTFTDPQFDLGGTIATFSGTGHAGFGVLCGTVDLGAVQAQFKMATGGTKSVSPSGSPGSQFACTDVSDLATGATTAYQQTLAGWMVTYNGSLSFSAPVGATPGSQATLVYTGSPLSFGQPCFSVNGSPQASSGTLEAICDPVPNVIDTAAAASALGDLQAHFSQLASEYVPQDVIVHPSVWELSSGAYVPDGSAFNTSQLYASAPYQSALTPASLYSGQNVAVLYEQTNELVQVPVSTSSATLLDTYFRWANSYVPKVGQGTEFGLTWSGDYPVTSIAYSLLDPNGQDVTNDTDSTSGKPVSWTAYSPNGTTNVYGTVIGFLQQFSVSGASDHVQSGWLDQLTPQTCIYCTMSPESVEDSNPSVSEKWTVSSSSTPTVNDSATTAAGYSFSPVGYLNCLEAGGNGIQGSSGDSGCKLFGNGAAPTSVSLSASPTPLPYGLPSTLTATTDASVTNTPYYIEIYDTSTGSLLTACGAGNSCSLSLTEYSPQTHTYEAVVAGYSRSFSGCSSTSGSNPPDQVTPCMTASVSWVQVTESLQVEGSPVAVGSTVAVTASTNVDVYSLSILLFKNGTLEAICQETSSCTASETESATGTSTWTSRVQNDAGSVWANSNNEQVSWVPDFYGSEEMAFQANTGALLYYGDAYKYNTAQGMYGGTSPSIAALTFGGEEEAFQANTGALYEFGDAGDANTQQGMYGGTSPSIAAVGNGYQIAMETNTSVLLTWGSIGQNQNWNLGMMSGTSPSIAALSGGGYEIAFVANTGDLYTVGSGGGSYDINWGSSYPVKAGSSPSITGLDGGGFEVAFQGGNGDLWTVGYGGGSSNNGDWNLGMMSNSSPSIANLPGVGWEAAFQSNAGQLWDVGSDGNNNTNLPMASGTSPAIGGSSNSGYEIAYQNSSGQLEEYGTAAWVDALQGMAPNTSPAIADPPIVPVNTTLSPPGLWGSIWRAASGYCVDDTGGSTSVGTEIQIWGCAGNANHNQNWRVLEGFSSTYVLENVVLLQDETSGMCLAVENQSGTDGTPAIQLPCSYNNPLEWVVLGINDLAWLGQNGGGEFYQGSFEIQLAEGPAYCLDDPVQTLENGLKLWFWPCNQTIAQGWMPQQYSSPSWLPFKVPNVYNIDFQGGPQGVTGG